MEVATGVCQGKNDSCPLCSLTSVTLKAWMFVSVNEYAVSAGVSNLSIWFGTILPRDSVRSHQSRARSQDCPCFRCQSQV